MTTIKEQYEQAARDIMRMTRITPEQYNTMMFERGIEFLQAECRGDEWAISIMSHAPMFWMWWKNLYGNRDLAWLEYVREGRMPGTMKSYRLHQSIDMIEAYPSTMIYQKSYTKLIKKINQE